MTKVFEFFSDRPVLFVLDNALDHDTIRNIHNASSLFGVKFLITTQSTEWNQNFIQKSVDVFSKELALGYYLACIPSPKESNENIIRFAEAVQCLPLALKHAVAYIKQCNCSIEEFMQDFETISDENAVLDTTKDENVVLVTRNLDENAVLVTGNLDENAMPVTDNLDENDVLVTDNLDENAVLVTDNLDENAVLDTDNLDENAVLVTDNSDEMYFKLIKVISKMAIRKVVKNRKEDLVMFILNIMSYLDGSEIKRSLFLHRFDENLLKNVLSDLHKFSIISISYNNADMVIKIHPLVQAVLKSMSESENGLKNVLSFLLEAVTEIQGEYFWNCWDKSAITVTSDSVFYVEHGNLWWRHFIYIFSSQNRKSNVLLSEIYKNIKSIFTVFEARERLDALYKLFLELNEQWNAVEKCELDFYIAKSLILLCRYDDAYQKLVDLQKFKTEFVHDNEATFLQTEQQIAFCIGKNGNTEESLKQLMLIQQRQEPFFNPMHPDLLQTKENISTCLMEMNNFHAAFEILQKIESNKQKIGASMYSTQIKIAKCMEILGELELSLAKYQEIELCEERLVKQSHSRLLCIRYSIASILQRQGKYELALKHFLEIEKSRRESLGRTHIALVKTQHSVASCLHKLEKYPLELEKYMEIEFAEEELYGTNHPSFLTTQHNIAACLKAQGKYDIALEKYQDIEKLETNLFGSEHPSSMATENNIALCLRKQNCVDQAIDKYIYIQQKQMDSVGDYHPSLLPTQQGIAECLEEQGELELALDKFLEIEESGRNALGSSNPTVLKMHDSVSSCLMKLENVDLSLQGDPSKIEVLDDTHIHLLTSQYRLANFLIKKGDFEMALDKLFEILDFLNNIERDCIVDIKILSSYAYLKTKINQDIETCISTSNLNI